MIITDEQEQAVDNWIEEYQPIENTYGDRGWNGLIFETYGLDWSFVKAHDSHHIWTWVDTDEGTAIMNGLHMVNRIGYFITMKAWTEPMTIQVNSEEE